MLFFNLCKLKPEKFHYKRIFTFSLDKLFGAKIFITSGIFQTLCCTLFNTFCLFF